MKNLRKVMVLVLALLVVFAFSVTAFAATGDITVNGPVEGAKYQAYKMFDVTVSGSGDEINVNYTLIDNKITEVTGFDTISTPGIAYVSMDPTLNRDLTPAPQKQPEDDPNDFFWLGQNFEEEDNG